MDNSSYEQMYTGETIEVETGNSENGGVKIACCHCGLIHLINVSVPKRSRKVRMTFREDLRATGQYRRYNKKNLKCKKKSENKK